MPFQTRVRLVHECETSQQPGELSEPCVCRSILSAGNREQLLTRTQLLFETGDQ